MNLSRVETLSLNLADIDVTRLLHSAPDKPRLWDMYADELARLCAGVRQLPNLRTLRVLEPKSMHSCLFRDLYERFLRRLPALLSSDSSSSRVGACSNGDSHTTSGMRDEKEHADADAGAADTHTWCQPRCLYTNTNLLRNVNPQKRGVVARWYSDPGAVRGDAGRRPDKPVVCRAGT